MLANEALDRFIDDLEGGATVLDIGSGAGEHADRMRGAGLLVTTIDLAGSPDIKAAYPVKDLPGEFDGIWASHVLEHQTDVGAFLRATRRNLRMDGVLALTVPPMRTKLVGGHLNQFTEGSLIYNMVLAGYDCSGARVGIYRYNVSVLVRHHEARLPELTHDSPDLVRLARYFPWPVKQGIDGRLGNVRWNR